MGYIGKITSGGYTEIMGKEIAAIITAVACSLLTYMNGWCS